MAGLSESCSHVGAVLFAIEAGVKMRETASCTTEKCKWLMPSHVKEIPAAPVAMIDFSSAKSKKQKLDDAIAGRTELQNACQDFRQEELTQPQPKSRKDHSLKTDKTQVLQTSLAQPSKSLIKSICYPEAHKFSTAATRYGCKYEATAQKQYEGVQSLHHQGFSCKDSELWLNPQWPYMGASPDGCVTCTCHGTGICEIKCPHSKQEEANLRLYAGEQGFCLVNDGGTVKLDRRHAYYHQVQAQLHVFDVDYCDFVVWTKNDLFVERIVRDVDLWDNIIPRVESFFRLCVLPEVLGQQLTRGKFQLQDDQEGEKP
ncbi:hypothetical protein JOQ06_004777 [Pogonophryne albipinna]|uniref:YqaJ viral recombinase domain-containing protein n=1 Tax=Pogonophryne albipinna TaxID=1090488 RepID=A0AAD6FCX8_9TELE|nr:hypothetical protein JOQ06_004777 [Pogonophryne albipinna]